MPSFVYATVTVTVCIHIGVHAPISHPQRETKPLAALVAPFWCGGHRERGLYVHEIPGNGVRGTIRTGAPIPSLAVEGTRSQFAVQCVVATVVQQCKMVTPVAHNDLPCVPHAAAGGRTVARCCACDLRGDPRGVKKDHGAQRSRHRVPYIPTQTIATDGNGMFCATASSSRGDNCSNFIAYPKSAAFKSR